MRVILAEKEAAGKVMAEILSNGNYEQKELEGITYFEFGDAIIVPARGHLLQPAIKGLITVKTLDDLPKSEIVWRIPKANRTRLGVIKKLGKGRELIVATDYDREGEVIGYTIAKELGLTNPEDIKRMYFSALTEDEIRNAYENLEQMNEEIVTQGLARNYADVLVGLNLTKSLTILFKSQYGGLSQAISLGRVQSPLLNHVNMETGVETRDEAWIEEEDVTFNKGFLLLDSNFYLLGNLPEEIESGEHQIEVTDVSESAETIEQAVTLFNTDDIMVDVKIDPKVIMNTLESLYLKGYSTYPRTKSRYIEPKILERLENTIRKYKELPEEFSYERCPLGEGEAKKQAIVLTEKGISALFDDRLKGREKLVAEIILNRMIKSFACPLEKVTTGIKFEVAGKTYNCEWSSEISNIDLALDYQETEARPDIEEGEHKLVVVRQRKNTKTVMSGIFSQEIRTFTDTDLVGWMSEAEIGTEATRSSFPSLLRSRNYTMESNLVTTLGDEIAKIVGLIGLDTELTSEMERKIGELGLLDELEDFTAWILDLTANFIGKMKNADIRFECPEGHNAELINTRYGLLMLCKACSAKGKFYRL